MRESRAQVEIGTERGATIVEAAIGVPVFLIFLFITFELLRLAYVGLASQFAVNAVLRDAIVGPTVFGANQGQYISQNVIARARRMAVTLEPDDIEICAFNDDAVTPVLIGCGPQVSGLRGNFMSVEIRTDVGLSFIGTFQTGGVAYAKNEAW